MVKKITGSCKQPFNEITLAWRKKT